ncbi:serine/threonine-protein kinase [Vitiosangium sp. GDMCC 1.1324]|uniref:serine/threonine protein kinase n=1 Tax=Vitiosangium sp. (strain GDMCC 1.1324) TaxID=2138576 RepID=UPI000D35A3E5|nr:serine/threonine-protein kinase [Vitiosangium sp. GDMCC 1.1324]PTL77807.1 serine/threonine protein kinase [Vitiosangium sp. GDMCC 1.1324]
MTHPASAPIRIGSILRDTYELISELGKGGMGAVFLAQHLRLPGKQVAVKVLHVEAEVQPELYARFHREAEITSRLGHPNIVEVLDFHSLEDGTPYLVMEYLRGASLSRRIRQGPIPLQEALLIARQIGSALHTAHQAGVVHRDLKPGNVFLVPTESGGVVGQQVKLLDFGISKLVTAQTLQVEQDVLIGTPRYMSPEQAMGRNSEVDARSDLFALGCIVYEMLAGRPPFSSDSVAELIYRIVHEPAEPLGQRCPDVPAHVVAAVDKALAKKPEERFPDVASFIAELTGSPLQTLPKPQPRPVARPRVEPAAASPAAAEPPRAEAPARTVSLRPESSPDSEPPRAEVPEPSPTPARTSRVPLVAGAAAVVLLCAAAAGWWWRSQPPPAPTVSVPERTAKAEEPTPKPSAPASPVVESPAETPPQAAPTTPQAGPATDAKAEEPASVAQAPEAAPVESRPAVRASARQGTPEVMPEEVRKELEVAERLLAAGNATEAIRVARRSQRTKISGASFSLLTRAHCHLGDLSNAAAQWRQVPSAERNRVRQYCKLYGIEFKP